MLQKVDAREPGRKDDQGKVPWELVPMQALEPMVQVLGFGRRKYGAWNWQKVENAEERYWAAAIRHLSAVQRGEMLDPESGQLHLGHAMCCLLFLTHIHQQGMEQKRESIETTPIENPWPPR